MLTTVFYVCPKCGMKHRDFRGDKFHCTVCYGYYPNGMTGWELFFADSFEDEGRFRKI